MVIGITKVIQGFDKMNKDTDIKLRPWEIKSKKGLDKEVAIHGKRTIYLSAFRDKFKDHEFVDIYLNEDKKQLIIEPMKLKDKYRFKIQWSKRSKPQPFIICISIIKYMGLSGKYSAYWDDLSYRLIVQL